MAVFSALLADSPTAGGVGVAAFDKYFAVIVTARYVETYLIIAHGYLLLYWLYKNSKAGRFNEQAPCPPSDKLFYLVSF